MAVTDHMCDALVRQIVEDPYDLTPRLVLADWLEENGTDLARASSIRVGVRRLGLKPGPDWCGRGQDSCGAAILAGPCLWHTLLHEENVLSFTWDLHPFYPWLRHSEFEAGFISNVEVDEGRFGRLPAENISSLFLYHPIKTIDVTGGHRGLFVNPKGWGAGVQWDRPSLAVIRPGLSAWLPKEYVRPQYDTQTYANFMAHVRRVWCEGVLAYCRDIAGLPPIKIPEVDRA
jgi:uncharacterized protein (TIGR02996 family)